MKRCKIAFLVFLFSVVLPGCTSQVNTFTTQLQRLFADDWEFSMREHPLFATEVGDHRFDDRLGRVSEADQKRRLAQEKLFLNRLYDIDRSALSEKEQLNYDIFERQKKNAIESYEFRTYLMPVDQMGGFHTHFAQIPQRLSFKNTTDYKNYISRLKAFASYTDEHIELMLAGLREGYAPPRVVMEGMGKSIEVHIVSDVNQSVFFEPFERFPDTISEDDRKELTRLGGEAIESSIVPAYRKFLDFMTKQYLPECREQIAASSLPNGREYYEFCIRRHTTLDMTAQQVHNIGLAEVKRIKMEMERVIVRTGFVGDMNDFFEFLRTDERFYVDTPEQLLKEISYVMKKIDGQLPGLFNKWPRIPVGIKQVPDYIAPKMPSAYYWPPTGDGTVAGFYYINTFDLKNRALYLMEVLALHEALPGHHLQISLQQEIEDIPKFRRFGWFTAYSEGWALYAESLGSNLGLYQEPCSDFGRLVFEMWRACRLVVDTGIHSMGWSRRQAIDYMSKNTGIGVDSIAREVDRYIVWPGQALAYKIGELKIRELRRLAEEKLGENFDIRQFHEVILSDGNVPLDVLESKVKAWLNRQER